MTWESGLDRAPRGRPELRLVAWQLRDGRHVEVADVAADETWTASLPFEVTVRPGSLPD